MAVQHFVERWVIPSQLILAMLGMGATLSVRDFVLVLRDGKGLLLGLALQLLLVPLLALAFITAFALDKGWAVGLILIAVVPGGAFSNLLTYLAGGNTALSVSLTTVSNVTCIGSIPLLLHLLVAEHVPAGFEVPTGNVIRDILLYLLLPLLAGMVVFRIDQRFAAVLSRWTIRGSVLLLLVVVVSSLASGRIDVAGYGWAPPLLLIAFGLVLCVASAQACRLLGRYDDDTVALSIEVAIRNVALALLLVRFFFDGEPAQGHVLYSCLFYGGLSFFIGFGFTARVRRGKSPALFGDVRRRPAPASLPTGAAGSEPLPAPTSKA